MLTFDTTTTGLLAAATSKLNYCEILATQLGTTGRTLVCKRAASGDAWADGTVFRDLDMTGTISTTGAVLSNLGVTSNARTQLAADLATGVSVWRISNAAGTRWVQGTLGAPGSGADVERPNPTTTSGDDFAGVVIKPPSLLPSGTGPAAPAWTSNTPRYAVLDPWVDGVFVDGEGVHEVEFDDRGPDWVSERAYIASEIGDVDWRRCSESITYGVHTFFPNLFRHHAGCSRSGTRPYEAMWISARPVNTEPGDWYTFPAVGTSSGVVVYDRMNPRHSTYPAPHRWRFLNDAREEVGRVEWPNDRPINDPLAVQDEYYNPATAGPANLSPYTSGGVHVGWAGDGPEWDDGVSVVQPHWNIASPLLWENEPPANMPPLVFHGVEDDALIPDMAKGPVTFNPIDHMYSKYGGEMASQIMPYVMAEYPRSRGVHPRMEPIDIHCSNPNSNTRPFNAWSIGYKYVPGWRNGHDVNPGPGGSRHDRAPIAMPIVQFLSARTGNRVEGDVPWRDFAWEFCKGYANLARTFVRDRELGSISKTESLQTGWRQWGGYYGQGPFGNAGISIDYVPIGASGNKHRGMSGYWDSTGRHPYGYQLPEGSHHGYSHCAQAALVVKDARFLIMQRYFFDTHLMSQLGAATPNADPLGYYGTRVHAWRVAAYFWTWFAAANHPLSYATEQIEARYQIELEKIDTDIRVPAYVSNGGNGVATLYHQGVRRFGAPMNEGNTRNVIVEGPGGSGSKKYYLGVLAMLQKTSGMWGSMNARSSGCENAQWMFIDNMAKASVDWIMATNGEWAETHTSEGQPYTANSGHMIITQDYASGHVITVADMPADWYGVPARLIPNGEANIFKSASGVYRSYEEVSVHWRCQWPAIHLRYFADDYPYPNLQEAHDIFKAFYVDRTEFARATETTPGMRMTRNCTYRIASMGFPNPAPVED